MGFPIDRRYLRRLLIVVGCLFATPEPQLVGASLPLFFAGGALHLWSKGCLEQNRRLTTSGPYRFVRNPFYLANAFVDGATCLVIGQGIVGLVFAVLWWTTYRATIEAEEVALTRLFGDAYRDYCARVPRLIPDGRRLSADRVAGGFSLSNPGLARGQEYARLLGMALGPFAIGVAYRIRNDGLALFSREGDASLAWVASLAALWIVKLALAAVFRRPDQALCPGLKSQRARLLLGLVFAAAVPFAAAARPWLAIWPGLWAVLLGLDAFRVWRSARFGPATGADAGGWAYFRNVAVGSVGFALLLFGVTR